MKYEVIRQQIAPRGPNKFQLRCLVELQLDSGEQRRRVPINLMYNTATTTVAEIKTQIAAIIQAKIDELKAWTPPAPPAEEGHIDTILTDLGTELDLTE